uniref:Putative ovule protein n=1 Tax=Solanum chacoense TaxID=4108 RepID=A0A0V0HBA8_SOLCH
MFILSGEGKRKQRIYSSSSGRHSSAGERGTSSSSLQIIIESPKQETPSFLNKRMSLDSWNFYRKKSKSTNSTSLSRKDGMLLNKKNDAGSGGGSGGGKAVGTSNNYIRR